MPLDIRFAAGFLVTPSRKAAGTAEMAEGSEVTVDRALHDRLERLFARELKTKIGIKFKPKGKQQNDIRDHILVIAGGRSALRSAERLARELGRAMDGRSSRSLFLVLTERAARNGNVPVHLLKFPHDDSFGADIEKNRLVVRVLDRAFTAQSNNFKAASFEDDPAAKTSFWKGVVEDRQARLSGGAVANYWVDTFLTAELLINTVQGTNAVADGLKGLLDSATPEEGAALTGAAQVLSKLGKKKVTFEDIAQDYLPEAMRDPFLRKVEREYRYSPLTTFEFDGHLLEDRFGFQVVMLANHVSVSAPVAEFDDLVDVTRHRDNTWDIRTSGTYAGTKLRRRAG